MRLRVGPNRQSRYDFELASGNPKEALHQRPAMIQCFISRSQSLLWINVVLGMVVKAWLYLVCSPQHPSVQPSGCLEVPQRQLGSGPASWHTHPWQSRSSGIPVLCIIGAFGLLSPLKTSKINSLILFVAIAPMGCIPPLSVRESGW